MSEPLGYYVRIELLVLSSLWLVLSSRAVLSLISLPGLSWPFQGACVCGFVNELASPLPMLEILACSCARRLFVLASVASGGFNEAVAIDEGVGGESL